MPGVMAISTRARKQALLVLGSSIPRDYELGSGVSGGFLSGAEPFSSSRPSLGALSASASDHVFFAPMTTDDGARAATLTFATGEMTRAEVLRHDSHARHRYFSCE